MKENSICFGTFNLPVFPDLFWGIGPYWMLFFQKNPRCSSRTWGIVNESKILNNMVIVSKMTIEQHPIPTVNALGHSFRDAQSRPSSPLWLINLSWWRSSTHFYGSFSKLSLNRQPSYPLVNIQKNYGKSPLFIG